MGLISELDIAVCSVTATPDKPKNIVNAISMVEQAASKGAQWIFLPEMFSYHGPYDQLFANAEEESGPLNTTLASLAQKLKIVLFAGSVAEKPKGSNSGKAYNTQYVFGRNGETLAKYRKIHLFNLINSEGAPLYCESDGYLSGDQTVTTQIDGWKVGFATCYDLRFPEMFTKLSENGPLDLLAIPAAFTLQTGVYHWELLCRARAVENLCYVAAANQVGLHQPGKASYGHAVVIDPWGNTICDTGNRIGFSTASISKATIEYWRSQLPALQNKRPEVY